MNLKRFLSLNSVFCLELLRDTYHFLLSLSASTHPLGWNYIRNYHSGISSPKREIILELDSSHHSRPPELNDPITSFIWSISDSTRADSEELIICSYWLPSLLVKSLSSIGKIHSAFPIKIQIDLSNSVLGINQYPVSKEVLPGRKPLI